MRIKKDALPLLERSIASLTLSIELFNRPSELARTHSVLILTHHAFELLLKALLIQNKISLFRDEQKYTIGFDKCLEIAENTLKVITHDERASLSILDAQRDQAQHYYSELTEDILYLHIQSSVTLYDRLLKNCFGFTLATRIPTRVLPISTRPPTDMRLLFDQEFQGVDALLTKGTRKSEKAAARLRALLAFVAGSRPSPERVSQKELEIAIKKRRKGKAWAVIFPEIAQLRLSTEGDGIPITMRITKDGEFAMRLVKDGEQAYGTVVKQEVNIWDKFNLSLTDLANKLAMTPPRVLALIYHLKIQSDPERYRRLTKGSIVFKGYSVKALE